jgi:uncharacterized protein (DUF983 family)
VSKKATLPPLFVRLRITATEKIIGKMMSTLLLWYGQAGWWNLPPFCFLAVWMPLRQSMCVALLHPGEK